MNDWRCTGECRWFRRKEPFIKNEKGEIWAKVTVLQQLWERGVLSEGTKEYDWRDVPTAEEPE